MNVAERMQDSYARLLGRPLVPATVPAHDRGRWLYDDAPFGLLAHDGGADPRFVYANRTAQQAFEYGYDDFVGMPSRLAADADAQEDRNQLLADVDAQGFAEGYRGVRISASGRRFWIEDVVMWNLSGAAGAHDGQAALFAGWRYWAP